MTGNLVAQQFTVAFNWPLGAALASVMVAVVLAVFAVFVCLVRLVARW
jgi:spermidine/putrescine transport system permease protein